jgi:integrase
VRRAKTGKEQMVQVHYGEGVANHTGPESCAVYREVCGEALTGVRAGQPLSRETSLIQDADGVANPEGKTSGALWRRVQRARVTTPLSEAAIYAIITQRAAQAGITGIGAHSLRAGFVTEALRLGNELFEVMDLTGHQSVQTVNYHRPQTLDTHSAARLLE